ncbi:MAG: DUF2933 domain-containing protein [Actinobacteria bacterium]|nr:DUF2933 domain-containing protein [Actinomycetota bacterium]
MCINKKVVAGLAAVGLGIWWLAPGAIGAAMPLLLIAICPLSMVFMMKAMGGMNGQHHAQSTGATRSTGEPTVPAGQLALPLAGDDAQGTPAATADPAWERHGPPAHNIEDAPDTAKGSTVPTASDVPADTAPPR